MKRSYHSDIILPSQQTNPKEEQNIDTSSWRDWIGIAFALLLIAGTYLILSPFLISIAWAIILTLATWPLYKKIQRLLRGRDNLSALIMCIGAVLLVIIPVILLIISSKEEVGYLYRELKVMVEKGISPAEEFPYLTKTMEWLKGRIPLESIDLRKLLMERAGLISNLIIQMGQNIFQNIFKIVITVFLLFFMYRDGEKFLRTLKDILPLSSEYRERLFSHLRDLIKSIVYGVFFTAIAQGLLAGIGFLMVGFNAPIFMGIATTVLAFIPYGAVLIWVPAAIWLFIQGSLIKGVILTVWGVGVISTIDNILRPIIISSTGRVPILLVSLGGLGGIMAFGMIGLFIGPVILSAGAAIVEEYVNSL